MKGFGVANPVDPTHLKFSNINRTIKSTTEICIDTKQYQSPPLDPIVQCVLSSIHFPSRSPFNPNGELRA